MQYLLRYEYIYLEHALNTEVNFSSALKWKCYLNLVQNFAYTLNTHTCCLNPSDGLNNQT